MDSLAHAKHNERVCNYLGRSADFGDWVITTAFYSAMHYVRHLMVPIMIEGDVYNDFESLFASLCLLPSVLCGYEETAFWYIIAEKNFYRLSEL